MGEPVRIAMLGSGFVAEFYMQGLANVNGQQVVVNYSRDPKRAKAFRKALGDSGVVDRSRRRLSRAMISTCTSSRCRIEEHLPVSLALSRAKSNQVCTKPLARNRNEAKQMYAAARQSGAMHGYAETEVFAPAVVKARETIEAGGLGRVIWVRSRESHSGPHSPHFWDVEQTGGGALNDLGCHCIEAARYFFGKQDKVVEVMAWGATLVHRDRTKGEDNALLVLKFESGGIGHCELSWTTKGGLDLRNEIHGSEGSIFTDVTRGTPHRFLHAEAGRIRHREGRYRVSAGRVRLPEEAFAYGYQAEMRHFVECVRDGREPRETYEDGYIVNCILDAGYESMKKNKWVKVRT